MLGTDINTIVEGNLLAFDYDQQEVLMPSIGVLDYASYMCWSNIYVGSSSRSHTILGGPHK